MKKKFYSLYSEGKEAELYIFGDITSWPWDEKDRDAYGIVKELQELDVDSINVHICLLYTSFITAMKSLGYAFDSRELVAADYGCLLYTSNGNPSIDYRKVWIRKEHKSPELSGREF